MSQERMLTNSLNEGDIPPTHSTFTGRVQMTSYLQLIALSLGGGEANIILPTCGCVHLRIDIDEALAPIQRPKPHTLKDEPEPPACSR